MGVRSGARAGEGLPATREGDFLSRVVLVGRLERAVLAGGAVCVWVFGCWDDVGGGRCVVFGVCRVLGVLVFGGRDWEGVVLFVFSLGLESTEGH